MIMKKRLPTLGRWFSSFDHIFGNARLSEIDTELEQLSVDPWRSPQWICYAHLTDNPTCSRVRIVVLDNSLSVKCPQRRDIVLQHRGPSFLKMAIRYLCKFCVVGAHVLVAKLRDD